MNAMLDQLRKVFHKDFTPINPTVKMAKINIFIILSERTEIGQWLNMKYFIPY